MILYALLCGTLPFDDENIPNLFKKIKVLHRMFCQLTFLFFEVMLKFGYLELHLSLFVL